MARVTGPARRGSTQWPSTWKRATVTTAEMMAWATWSNLSTPSMSQVS